MPEMQRMLACSFAQQQSEGLRRHAGTLDVALLAALRFRSARIQHGVGNHHRWHVIAPPQTPDPTVLKFIIGQHVNGTTLVSTQGRGSFFFFFMSDTFLFL